MPRFEDLAAEGQALVELGGEVVGVDVATQAALTDHAADTTDVHGIADTSVLETTAGAQAKADAAEAAANTYTDNATYAPLAVMFTEFAAKANGDPPSLADTGQTVDFLSAGGTRKPQVSNGKLGHGTLPASGSYADYYQVDLGTKATRIGSSFTWPTNPTADGAAAIVLWDTIYEATGSPVSSSVCHLVLTPGTGAQGSWEYAVVNNAGNFAVVKTGTFTNPPSDGATPWVVDVVVDWAAETVAVFLPDGQVLRITAAEIAAAWGANPAVAFANLGGKVAGWEHYANANANTAKYPEFIDVWSDTEPVSGNIRAATPQTLAKVAERIVPAPTSVMVAPTTALAQAVTTSATNITGASVTGTAGPTGRLIVTITAYIEFTGTDTLFGRLAVGSGVGATPTRGLHRGVAGDNANVCHTVEVANLTPGRAYACAAQVWAATGGVATVRAGGSGGGLYPPLTMVALPA